MKSIKSQIEELQKSNIKLDKDIQKIEDKIDDIIEKYRSENFKEYDAELEKKQHEIDSNNAKIIELRNNAMDSYVGQYITDNSYIYKILNGKLKSDGTYGHDGHFYKITKCEDKSGTHTFWVTLEVEGFRVEIDKKGNIEKVSSKYKTTKSRQLNKVHYDFHQAYTDDSISIENLKEVLKNEFHFISKKEYTTVENKVKEYIKTNMPS